MTMYLLRFVLTKATLMHLFTFSPTDVFAVSMKVKHLNRVANQVSYQTKCRRKLRQVFVLIRHMFLPIFFHFQGYLYYNGWMRN